jgi:hypothetical protein
VNLQLGTAKSPPPGCLPASPSPTWPWAPRCGTINRLEVGGAIYVATKKRHGHVELTLWNRIIDALTQHGIELLPNGDRRGSGVRWLNPRVARATKPG